MRDDTDAAYNGGDLGVNLTENWEKVEETSS